MKFRHKVWITLKNRTMKTTTHTTEMERNIIKEDLIREFSKQGNELFTINSEQGLKDLCKLLGFRKTFNFEYGSGVSCYNTEPYSWSSKKPGIRLTQTTGSRGNRTWTEFLYGKQYTCKVVEQRLFKMHNIHVKELRRKSCNDYETQLNEYLSTWTRENFKGTCWNFPKKFLSKENGYIPCIILHSGLNLEHLKEEQWNDMKEKTTFFIDDFSINISQNSCPKWNDKDKPIGDLGTGRGTISARVYVPDFSSWSLRNKSWKELKLHQKATALRGEWTHTITLDASLFDFTHLNELEMVIKGIQVNAVRNSGFEGIIQKIAESNLELGQHDLDDFDKSEQSTKWEHRYWNSL